ncbi:lipoprotein [Neotabrizicola sp. VNH66]|uniref:lipoprotein n=1 Tax=Neotabrizicola sp. VNH66 TaxID=3400918 RepID=UPI003C00596E
MKRIITALSAALFLAACETEEEQRDRINRTMPDGCVMSDLGEYKEIDRLIVIQCDGRKTTTTVGTDIHHSGKFTYRDSFVAVRIGGAS